MKKIVIMIGIFAFTLISMMSVEAKSNSNMKREMRSLSFETREVISMSISNDVEPKTEDVSDIKNVDVIIDQDETTSRECFNRNGDTIQCESANVQCNRNHNHINCINNQENDNETGTIECPYFNAQDSDYHMHNNCFNKTQVNNNVDSTAQYECGNKHGYLNQNQDSSMGNHYGNGHHGGNNR